MVRVGRRVVRMGRRVVRDSRRVVSEWDRRHPISPYAFDLAMLECLLEHKLLLTAFSPLAISELWDQRRIERGLTREGLGGVNQTGEE